MPSSVRYWDGREWTDHVAPAGSVASPVAAGSSEPWANAGSPLTLEQLEQIDDARSWSWRVPWVAIIKANKVKKFAPNEASSIIRRAVMVQVAVIALLVGVVFVLPNLGGPSADYQGDDLATDVVTALNRGERLNGLSARVESAECEDAETIETGAVADCTVELGDGSSAKVRVTFEGSDGHFRVEPY